MKPPAQYEVTANFRGEDVSRVVSARSRSAARFGVYRDWSDVWEISFRDFLRHVRSVRRTGKRTPYDYIRERHGVHVEVGQRIAACGRQGYVVEPESSRDCYVRVLFDGVSDVRAVHPVEIQP